MVCLWAPFYLISCNKVKVTLSSHIASAFEHLVTSLFASLTHSRSASLPSKARMATSRDSTVTYRAKQADKMNHCRTS